MDQSRAAIGLEECSSLSGKDWQTIKPTSGSVTITSDGRVHFKVRPDGGKTKFFRMVNKNDAEYSSLILRLERPDVV